MLKLEDIDPKEDIRMTGAELRAYLVGAMIEALNYLKRETKTAGEYRSTAPVIHASHIDEHITGVELKELTGGRHES